MPTKAKKNTANKKTPKKWEYWLVIQQYWSGWEDVMHFEANSRGVASDFVALRDTVKSYKKNQKQPVRVVFRKEPIK